MYFRTLIVFVKKETTQVRHIHDRSADGIRSGLCVSRNRLTHAVVDAKHIAIVWPRLYYTNLHSAMN